MSHRLALALGALALLAPAPALAAPEAGEHHGTDELERHVAFSVHGSTVANFRLRDRLVAPNMHISHRAFHVAKNGVEITGRFTSTTEATGTLTAGGATVRWTTARTEPLIVPKRGPYTGKDQYGRAISFRKVAGGIVADFALNRGILFYSQKLHLHAFHRFAGGLDIHGAWIGPKTVVGTVSTAYGLSHWKAHVVE